MSVRRKLKLHRNALAVDDGARRPFPSELSTSYDMRCQTNTIVQPRSEILSQVLVMRLLTLKYKRVRSCTKPVGSKRGDILACHEFLSRCEPGVTFLVICELLLSVCLGSGVMVHRVSVTQVVSTQTARG